MASVLAGPIKLPGLSWEVPGDFRDGARGSDGLRREGTLVGYNAIVSTLPKRPFPPGKLITVVWRSVSIQGDQQYWEGGLFVVWVSLLSFRRVKSWLDLQFFCKLEHRISA